MNGTVLSLTCSVCPFLARSKRAFSSRCSVLSFDTRLQATQHTDDPKCRVERTCLLSLGRQ